MTKKTYSLLFEPQNSEYYDLLEYAVTECTCFQFILRDTIGLSAKGKGIIRSLSSFLITKVRTSEWPGTTLMNNKATLYKYRFNHESAMILKGSSMSLYQWQQPDYPEDLCFLRMDDSPWLVTIAHEKDGFLILSETEIAILFKKMPIYSSFLIMARE